MGSSISSSSSSTVALLTSALGALAVVRAGWSAYGLLHPATRADVIRATTWCAIMAAWPVVWQRVATAQGCERCSAIGLVWPYAVMAADVALHQHVGSRARLHIEPATLTSATFAIAGMVGALSDPVRVRFFLAPVLLNLLIVMPTPVALPHESETRALTETVQRAVVTLSAALVVTGITYRKDCARRGTGVVGT